MNQRMYFSTIESPIGDLLLVSNGEALTGLYMENDTYGPKGRDGWARDDRALIEVAGQLHAYFAGELTEFDLRLAPEGTEFQRRVWNELQTIPFGVTISYGDLARRIGQPSASRAVGLANGRNPISIVIPCHRVIGSNGSLTGYGGGLDRKRILLDHEAETLARIENRAHQTALFA